MHWSGYTFNTYADMLEIIRVVADRIDGQRVLAYLPGWEGRYYWQYGDYRPSPELGGEEGFAALCSVGARFPHFRAILPQEIGNQQPVSRQSAGLGYQPGTRYRLAGLVESGRACLAARTQPPDTWTDAAVQVRRGVSGYRRSLGQ